MPGIDTSASNNAFNTHNRSIYNVVLSARSHFKRIREDLTLPEEHKPEIIERERAKYAQQLKEAIAAAKGAIQKDREGIKRAAARGYLPAGDTVAGRLADEAVWRRVRELLDSGVQVKEILDDAVSRQDRRTIKVLSEEVRAYEWVKGNKDAGDALEPLFMEAKAATSGGYAAHMEALAKTEEAAAVIEYNASAAEAALRDDESPAIFADLNGSVIREGDS